MKDLISITATTLVIVGISVAPAAAKHRKHHVSHQMTRGGGSYGMLPMRGNNAELMGNNGNSGQGSNSLGHIQGGNIGGGK